VWTAITIQRHHQFVPDNEQLDDHVPDSRGEGNPAQ
jgi:hypothetical protein